MLSPNNGSKLTLHATPAAPACNKLLEVPSWACTAPTAPEFDRKESVLNLVQRLAIDDIELDYNSTCFERCFVLRDVVAEHRIKDCKLL